MEQVADDPWADRVVKDCPRLSRVPLESHQLWKFSKDHNKEVPDMSILRKYILGEGLL